MEKKKPHYSLAQIKASFDTVRRLRITRTALQCAEGLGVTLEGIVSIIQSMSRGQFFRSMTSVANATVWQDVYHVPFGGSVLYVKLTTDAAGYLVISFKEK